MPDTPDIKQKPAPQPVTHQHQPIASSGQYILLNLPWIPDHEGRRLRDGWRRQSEIAHAARDAAPTKTRQASTSAPPVRQGTSLNGPRSYFKSLLLGIA